MKIPGASDPKRINLRTHTLDLAPAGLHLDVARGTPLVLDTLATLGIPVDWCVTRTGFREASMAFIVVRSPQCEMSTAMPTSFMRSTI